MSKTCSKGHTEDHSMGDPKWLRGCAQCEVEFSWAELERHRAQYRMMCEREQEFKMLLMQALFALARYREANGTPLEAASPVEKELRDRYGDTT